MNYLSYKKFEELRESNLSTSGIMLTERCPVGCLHCSVNANNDSLAPIGPGFDEDSFLNWVHHLSIEDQTKVICITGGEPFLHLDLLLKVSKIIKANHKLLAIHTSAYWGNSKREKSKVLSEILNITDTIIIGIDTFHMESLNDDILISAIKKISHHKTWVVAQALLTANSENIQLAENILIKSFGSNWNEKSEISEIPPINKGKAISLSGFKKSIKIKDESLCKLVRGPVLHYDGTVSACCNEDVLKGKAPSALSFKAHINKSPLELVNKSGYIEMLQKTSPHHILEVINSITHQESSEPSSMCNACWEAAKKWELLDTIDKNKLLLQMKLLQGIV